MGATTMLSPRARRRAGRGSPAGSDRSPWPPPRRAARSSSWSRRIPTRLELGLAPDRLHGGLLVGGGREADAHLIELDPEVGDAAGVMDQLVQGDLVPPRRRPVDVGADRVDTESRPSRCSIRMAVAVNCFDTDAMSKRVCVVSGVPVARSARPPAPAQVTAPSTATAAEHPGPLAGTSSASAASLRSESSAIRSRNSVPEIGVPGALAIGCHRASRENRNGRTGEKQSDPARRPHESTVAVAATGALPASRRSPRRGGSCRDRG